MKKPAYTLIFGLTADPIHSGHEQVMLNSFAFAQQHALNIDKFLLVPTYQPNLIADKQHPRTTFEHRYNMCQLVAENIKNQYNYPVYVSDVEKQLFELSQQKSYSYDTLNAIGAKHKLFVLSADHFAGRWPKFRKWHRWQQLVKENGLMIHQRPGHRINIGFIEQLKQINTNVYVVSGLPSIDVSSTQLRAELSNNNNVSAELVSTSVLGYITKHNLYDKN
jgi:nicotinate (nicotinamide) nucleotide adenylyltransferase